MNLKWKFMIKINLKEKFLFEKIQKSYKEITNQVNRSKKEK